MKYLFNFVFFLFFLFPSFVLSKNYNATYKIKTNGLLIGRLGWDLQTNENSYVLNIELKNKGMLSMLFSFGGSYSARGKIIENNFVSTHYSQRWETNKKKRDVEISFKDGRVLSLKQIPKEKESLRIDLGSLTDLSDPLTSFLKLLNGSGESKTVDGRRSYTLQFVKEDQKRKKYVVKNFSNLWADHKRNGLEYIYFEEGANKFIPNSILISFKGRLFKVLID